MSSHQSLSQNLSVTQDHSTPKSYFKDISERERPHLATRALTNEVRQSTFKNRFSQHAKPTEQSTNMRELPSHLSFKAQHLNFFEESGSRQVSNQKFIKKTLFTKPMRKVLGQELSDGSLEEISDSEMDEHLEVDFQNLKILNNRRKLSAFSEAPLNKQPEHNCSRISLGSTTNSEPLSQLDDLKSPSILVITIRTHKKNNEHDRSRFESETITDSEFLS